MNAKQYRKALDELGWSQVEAAKWLGLDPRTSRRYALGERKIPRPVEYLLQMHLKTHRDLLRDIDDTGILR